MRHVLDASGLFDHEGDAGEHTANESGGNGKALPYGALVLLFVHDLRVVFVSDDLAIRDGRRFNERDSAVGIGDGVERDENRFSLRNYLHSIYHSPCKVQHAQRHER